MLHVEDWFNDENQCIMYPQEPSCAKVLGVWKRIFYLTIYWFEYLWVQYPLFRIIVVIVFVLAILMMVLLVYRLGRILVSKILKPKSS